MMKQVTVFWSEWYSIWGFVLILGREVGDFKHVDRDGINLNNLVAPVANALTSVLYLLATNRIGTVECGRVGYLYWNTACTLQLQDRGQLVLLSFSIIFRWIEAISVPLVPFLRLFILLILDPFILLLLFFFSSSFLSSSFLSPLFSATSTKKMPILHIDYTVD